MSLRVKYRMSYSPSPTLEFGSSVTTVRYVQNTPTSACMLCVITLGYVSHTAVPDVHVVCDNSTVSTTHATSSEKATWYVPNTPTPEYMLSVTTPRYVPNTPALECFPCSNNTKVCTKYSCTRVHVMYDNNKHFYT